MHGVEVLFENLGQQAHEQIVKAKTKAKRVLCIIAFLALILITILLGAATIFLYSADHHRIAEMMLLTTGIGVSLCLAFYSVVIRGNGKKQ